MDITEQSQAISASYRLIAGRLLNQANNLFAAKRITLEQYNQASLTYLSLIQKAVDINMAASHALAQDFKVNLGEIEQATAKLTQASERLARAAKIVEFGVKIVSAAALVVAAIFDPTKVSAAAAAASVLSVAHDISELAPDD